MEYSTMSLIVWCFNWGFAGLLFYFGLTLPRFLSPHLRAFLPKASDKIDPNSLGSSQVKFFFCSKVLRTTSPYKLRFVIWQLQWACRIPHLFPLGAVRANTIYLNEMQFKICSAALNCSFKVKPHIKQKFLRAKMRCTGMLKAASLQLLYWFKYSK